MKIGYVRTSTEKQNNARQKDLLLKQFGVERVFIDRMSGKDTDRPALKEMMNFVRDGDIVVTESISRFARNTKDLLELIEQLHKKNVRYISQKENIDTQTATGKFILTLFGAIAELERENILQRQREGIAIAKEQGKYKGRPAKELKNFEEIYSIWKAGKISATMASRELGVSRSTFYRKISEYEHRKKED